MSSPVRRPITASQCAFCRPHDSLPPKSIPPSSELSSPLTKNLVQRMGVLHIHIPGRQRQQKRRRALRSGRRDPLGIERPPLPRDAPPHAGGRLFRNKLRRPRDRVQDRLRARRHGSPRAGSHAQRGRADGRSCRDRGWGGRVRGGYLRRGVCLVQETASEEGRVGGAWRLSFVCRKARWTHAVRRASRSGGDAAGIRRSWLDWDSSRDAHGAGGGAYHTAEGAAELHRRDLLPELPDADVDATPAGKNNRDGDSSTFQVPRSSWKAQKA